MTSEGICLTKSLTQKKIILHLKNKLCDPEENLAAVSHDLETSE